jgi:hypothetical protein
MEGMLGGIVGLVGAGLQAQAQAAQVQYEYAALNWQKQRAREQDRFAQAARVDMYGNRTGYDELLNEWSVKLAPDQAKIRDAQQKEQLLQLTEDAPAARAIRKRVQQRSKEAVEPFQRAQLGYQYDQPKSEGAIRADLTNLMATNDMLRSKADQSLIMRQAMRLGRGGKAQDIINATDAQLGKNTPDRMLEARKQALAEHGQRVQQHEAEWGTPMRFWGDLMAQGGNMPEIGKNSLEQALNAQIGQQSQGMQSAFAQGTQGVGSAMQALAAAVGKSPNLSGISFGKGGGMGGAGKGTGTGATVRDDQIYDPTADYGSNNLFGGGFGGSGGWGSGWGDDRSAYGWE